MDSNQINELAKYFQKFPGIGPRQAQRFVYFLLNKDTEYIEEFLNLIKNLKNNVVRCSECQIYFGNSNNTKEKSDTRCDLCQNQKRNKGLLLVVEKSIDRDNVEKAGFYDGYYFILGGLVPALAKMPDHIKMREFFEKVKKDCGNKVKPNEIILAFSVTPEGDNTVRYIEKILEPITKTCKIKMSRLGRGLSTGTELEYSDSETIKSAFKNRK